MPDKTLKILFIGDINGQIGRKAVVKILPRLKKKYKPDLIIANAENIAHGKGTTATAIKEVMAAGVHWFTGGNHSFAKLEKINECFDEGLPVLRPANFSNNCPGVGFSVIKIKQHQILLISLIGRVFMDGNYNCPLQEFDNILANFTKENLSAIIVDIHAEATAEKQALSHYLANRASAVIGTHTHVMTADAHITDAGQAYISDAGMTGFADGVLGVEKENIIKMLLNQIKLPHVLPETGRAILNGVLIEINSRNARAISIEPIIETIKIK